MILPAYLKKGDTIGIVCPSGFMPLDRVKSCIETLQQWGYKVKTGNTVGSQYHYFSGTDEERLADLQEMMDDEEIKAILCGRGGYGLSRIIDRINFKAFKKCPKWIIGYSDITLLHMHIFRKFGISTIHSPMASAFNDGNNTNKYIQSLKKMLTGKKMSYSCLPHPLNQKGQVVGKLVGGNLSLLSHSCGTPSEPITIGSILFLEDLGEYIYNIDRMLQQLKRSGKLSKLNGLIIGSFTEMKDTIIPYGKEVYEVILDAVKDYDYPVCFNFPVGHTNENYALKIGVQYELNVGGKTVKLKEI